MRVNVCSSKLQLSFHKPLRRNGTNVYNIDKRPFNFDPCPAVDFVRSNACGITGGRRGGSSNVGEVTHCHRSHDFTVRRDVTSYAWSPFLFLPMTGVEAWCDRCRFTVITKQALTLNARAEGSFSDRVIMLLVDYCSTGKEWELYVFSLRTHAHNWKSLKKKSNRDCIMLLLN